jgi:transposase
MNKPTPSDQKKIETLKSQGTLNPSPQKVRDPLFQNEEFFDPRDIVQVKYELLRRVLVEKQSITNAVKSFGVSRLFFYRIHDAFEKQGLHGFIPERRGPKQAHKLTAEVLEVVDQQIAKDPSSNSTQLKKAIEESCGLVVHTRSIERALLRRRKKKGKAYEQKS